MATKPTKKGAHLAPPEHNKINKLVALSTDHLAPPKQYQLNIGIKVEKSVGGILSKAKLLPGGKLEAEQIAALFDQKVISDQGVQGH